MQIWDIINITKILIVLNKNDFIYKEYQSNRLLHDSLLGTVEKVMGGTGTVITILRARQIFSLNLVNQVYSTYLIILTKKILLML